MKLLPQNSDVDMLRALDGLHLAVAITESLPLMTADRDLPKTAKRHKRSVIQIR